MAYELLQWSAKVWKVVLHKPALAAPLTAIGLLWSASKLYNVAAFTYFHFFRPSNLDRYKVDSRGSSVDAWALVTGASDGIGKGFAHELCKHGFNVVLHGRNEQKLNGVKNDLLRQWPNRQVRVVIIEGSAPFDIVKFENALLPVKGLNLKLLINNVGGKDRPWYVPLQNLTAEDVRMWMDLNMRFHVEITRILLPQLIQNSPAAVVDIGSIAAEMPLAWMTVYNGAKAFLKHWTCCMDAEMRAEGHDVHFYYIQTGEVSSNAYPKEVSIMIPTARTFAKHTLDKIGGSRRTTTGYWAHAIFLNLPSWMLEKTAIQIMRQNMELEQRDVKSQ